MQKLYVLVGGQSKSQQPYWTSKKAREIYNLTMGPEGQLEVFGE